MSNFVQFLVVGEAAGGQSSLNTKDVVLYDGAKSHISQYSFCYLCKERLDTYHDEVDENWYFIDTKQVRFKQAAESSINGAREASTGGVFNVHTNCLKEIEEINLEDAPAAKLPQDQAKAGSSSASMIQQPV